MDQATRLKYSAIFFGVFWTIFMAWWSGSYEPAHLVILAVCGAIAALLWYWIMGRYFRWIARRNGQQS